MILFCIGVVIGWMSLAALAVVAVALCASDKRPGATWHTHRPTDETVLP